MQSQIESQIQAMTAEKIESEQTQKTNLEEQNHHKHHVSKVSIHLHPFTIASHHFVYASSYIMN